MDNYIEMKFYVEPYITFDGIEVSIDCDNFEDYSVTKGWSQIVDELFEMNKIPYQHDTRTIIPYFGNVDSGLDQIYENILALETVALKLRRRLEESYVLDHTTWKSMGEKEPHIKRFTYDYLYVSKNRYPDVD